MRRLYAACGLVGLLSGSAPAAEEQPYGCWAIRDPVERLACFDLAVGPPVFGAPAGSPETAKQERFRPEAAMPASQPGATTRD